jgi:competence protein ComEC
LTVTFLDVGQGDAILIEGPDGHRVLVDGGPGGQPISEALARNLPFDDRRIDLVVPTHPDADHISGLFEVLDRYDVRAVLNTPLPCASTLCDAWTGALAASGATVLTADRGQVIDLGGGAVLRVLAPDVNDVLLPITATNTGSTVIRLEMGDASFLLTGDLDASGEAALIRSGAVLQATVLKVGHHGSTTATTPEFVARVQPAIDVISVGAGNPFNHPRSAVLDRLTGDAVFRTDQNGDIRISTDGSRLWIQTDR